MPINGTCIENAVNFDTTELQDKQQVRLASRLSRFGGGCDKMTDGSQFYFQGLLWATFGLSMVRFVGVSVRFLRDFGRCVERPTDVYVYSVSITGLRDSSGGSVAATDRLLVYIERTWTMRDAPNAIRCSEHDQWHSNAAG